MRALTGHVEDGGWTSGSGKIPRSVTSKSTAEFDDDMCPDFEVKVDHVNSDINIQQARKQSWRTVWQKSGRRGVLREMLVHPTFDAVVSGIVIANSISIGLEQKYRLERSDPAVFRHLETAFLVLYTLELCLQFYAWGLRCLSSNWVKFDCTLVLMGIVSWTVDTVFQLGEGNPVSSLMVLRIARLLRLARVARAVRLVSRFRELGMLARGLVNSLGTAFHTLVFGVILLYVVACATTELIPLAMQESPEPIDQNVQNIIESSFLSLPMTLLTLVQFVTFDNVVTIYKPLIESDASLALFFMPVLLLVGVVYMNLVTAIIVNSGLEQSMQEKELKDAAMKAKSKRLIKELEEAFVQIDANNSGTISRSELDGIDLDGKAFIKGTLGVDDLVGLFDLLDVDGRGEIGIFDFCRSIDSIVVSEVPPAMKRMERMLESLHRQAKETQYKQDRLFRAVERMFSALQVSACAPTESLVQETMTVSSNADIKTWVGEIVKSHESYQQQKPVWVDELVADLKQVCTEDIRHALDEACASLLVHVADGTATPPTPPHVAEEVCSFHLSEDWEAIPEVPEPCTTTVRTDAPLSAEGLWAERDDPPTQQPPLASASHPRGGTVPKALRPELLLSMPAMEAIHGAVSIRSARQEL